MHTRVFVQFVLSLVLLAFIGQSMAYSALSCNMSNESHQSHDDSHSYHVKMALKDIHSSMDHASMDHSSMGHGESFVSDNLSSATSEDCCGSDCSCLASACTSVSAVCIEHSLLSKNTKNIYIFHSIQSSSSFFPNSLYRPPILI